MRKFISTAYNFLELSKGFFEWIYFVRRIIHSVETFQKTLFILFIAFFLLYVHDSTFAQVRFIDDFENGLSGWYLVGAHAIKIIDSNNSEHKNVLMLQPDGIVYALVKESDKWGSVRIDGEVLFPTDGQNYFGLIYNCTQINSRFDFGEIYLKGNGSYLRVNPWRDGNVSRLLYEEYKTPLRGDQAIRINQWHKFKAEIIGSVCHFYINDMTVPKITFALFEHSSGLVGFQPRIVGDPVWIDNIKITSIKDFSYDGPYIPEIDYEPDSLITNWEVIGPLTKPLPDLEWSPDPSISKLQINGEIYEWKHFEVDARGCVITGRVTEYTGDRPVAYFRTVLEADTPNTVVLHFSTVDEIALWVNGRYNGFVYRDGYISLPGNDWNAWYDFYKNPDHVGSKVPIELKSGSNQIIIRVRNGQFASGGFFMKVESD